MRVSLVDIDSKIPNLALHKIAIHHLDRGDTVSWNAFLEPFDKRYISCVFSANRNRAAQVAGNNCVIGGSGWDLITTLPEEIESIKPKINLGFTTRGCIRNCEFCIVPQKEGKIRVVGDLLDLWDGYSKSVCVMDNNILAVPEHFNKVCRQARDNKIKVDFNQGLDHRLMNLDIAKTLKGLSHAEYKFAFDHPSYKQNVEKTIELLKSVGINRCTWYVLVGFNTTFEQDLWRCNFLKKHNQNAFVQRYETCYHQTEYSLLARWANQHGIFHSYTFEEFVSHPKHRKQAMNCSKVKNMVSANKRIADEMNNPFEVDNGH